MCLFCGSSTNARLQYNRPAVRPLGIAEQLDGNADIILHGGPILTMNPGRPEAAALAVRNGLVQSVGSLEEAMSRKGRLTRVLDLDGRAVLPGFVLADMPKDPVDFLDWQSVEGLWPAPDDMDAFVASSVMPSIFAEPVYVRISTATEPSTYKPFLAALGRLCGSAPLAIRLHEAASGFANNAMLRLARCQAESANRADGFTLVENLSTALRPLALSEQPSMTAVSRSLDEHIRAASVRGFTTVVDRRMGSVAGKLEIDAAARVLGRSRRMRMNAVAHERLRREWDGALPEDLPAGRLCVDAASVSVGDPNVDPTQEVTALHEAGWRIAFDAHRSDDLETVARICAGLAARKHAVAGRHCVDVSFVPDARQASELDRLGLRLSVEPKPRRHARDFTNDRNDPLQPTLRHLVSLTSDAALSRGLESVAGMIDVGRRADFTVLEKLPVEPGAIRVNCVWVDGAPV